MITRSRPHENGGDLSKETISWHWMLLLSHVASAAHSSITSTSLPKQEPRCDLRPSSHHRRTSSGFQSCGICRAPPPLARAAVRDHKHSIDGTCARDRFGPATKRCRRAISPQEEERRKIPHPCSGLLASERRRARVVGNRRLFAVYLDLVMVTDHAALGRATVQEVTASAFAVISVQL